MAAGDVLSERDSWTLDICPIAATFDVVGSKSAWLLLREATFGTRRFADFAARAGLSEPVAAKWLRLLVDHGLLERRAYREPGQRAREEYRLTERGRDLVPVLVALRQWGDRHAVGTAGAALLSQHRGCGAEVHAVLRCDAGHDVGPGEQQVVAGPGLRRTGPRARSRDGGH